MFARLRGKTKDDGEGNGRPPTDATLLIDLKDVSKAYETPTGPFFALKDINLQVDNGEFVAVIGKSGSGKTTLVNMITGIDRPTLGQVIVGGTPIHELSEGQVSPWRGLNVGLVFQFFQLLPSLTNVENVMLPMDFSNTFKNNKERQARALHLLDLVDIEEHAFKKPSEISGGQQQRVAIARSLANDPPIIVADEPTGNLDSVTAQAIFELFERLVDQGKTIFMVTHDKDLARRVTRTIILSDGEIIDEYLETAFPKLDDGRLAEARKLAEPQSFTPGETILAEGEQPQKCYIVNEGAVEILLREPNGQQISVARLKPGQYFEKIDLLRGGAKIAMVIADPGYDEIELLALEKGGGGAW
ncbi:MAG: ATP-binding cassette domain-containing protein [Chloroflexi bacterium]|nr:ATP-binding cassette domain-containing protein [Chloroflexota bacterium]